MRLVWKTYSGIFVAGTINAFNLMKGRVLESMPAGEASRRHGQILRRRDSHERADRFTGHDSLPRAGRCNRDGGYHDVEDALARQSAEDALNKTRQGGDCVFIPPRS
jgi:hypothetical protein